MTINNLKRINNTAATEVTLPNGLMVLYSYSTPVAVRHLVSGLEYRTSQKYSSTTTKHLNRWCSKSAILCPQQWITLILEKGISAVRDANLNLLNKA